MRTDFDRCFESVFLGNRQAEIVHKWHVGDDVYHVCTIDANDHYSEGQYHLDLETWTFTRLESRRGLCATESQNQ